MSDPGPILDFLQAKLDALQARAKAIAPSGEGDAVGLYVRGLSTEAELRGDLQSLGYEGIRADRLVRAAKMRRQLEIYSERLVIWREQVKAGKISPTQLQAALEAAGVTAEQVHLELTRDALIEIKLAERPVDVGITYVLLVPPLRKPKPERPVDIGLTYRLARVLPPTPLQRAVDVGLRLAGAVVAPVPRPVERAVDVGLSLASVRRLAGPLPAAAAVDVGLRIGEIQDLPPMGQGARPVDVGLALTGVQGVPAAAPPERPVDVGILVAVEAVAPEVPAAAPVEVGLSIGEYEEVT